MKNYVSRYFAAVRTVKYFVQKCIFYITENFVVHIWNFLILEVYILDIIRHSILRDGSGPRRLNRHSQEILILYICKYVKNVSVMWKCWYCVYWYKVCVLPVCEAFYLYPAPHLDACNGHPVPAEPASTWAVLLCSLVKKCKYQHYSSKRNRLLYPRICLNQVAKSLNNKQLFILVLIVLRAI